MDPNVFNALPEPYHTIAVLAAPLVSYLIAYLVHRPKSAAPALPPPAAPAPK